MHAAQLRRVRHRVAASRPDIWLHPASGRPVPKQGSKFPWRAKQSYVADYRALKMMGIDDDAIVFYNSVPAVLEPVAIAGS